MWSTFPWTLTLVQLTCVRALDYCAGDGREIGDPPNPLFNDYNVLYHSWHDEGPHPHSIPTNETTSAQEAYHQIAQNIAARAKSSDETEACGVGYQAKNSTYGFEATWYAQGYYESDYALGTGQSNGGSTPCQNHGLDELQLEQAVMACASDMNACHATAACCEISGSVISWEEPDLYWSVKLKLSTQPIAYPSYSLKCTGPAL